MNKRGAVLAIALIVVAVVAAGAIIYKSSVAPQFAPPQCTDSDGGKNYNVQGTTCPALSPEGEPVCSTDVCVSNATLTEYYCGGKNNLTVQSISYNCPYGCSGGKCNSAPPVEYTLTVQKSGTGSGTVTSVPSGINCGSDCSESYNSGTVVTLTAAASSGSKFVSWSGSCSGSSKTCEVTMDSGGEVVTAKFDLNSSNTTMPDLDIISFTKVVGNKTNSTYPVTLFATIKNIGTASAGNSTTRFYISPTEKQIYTPVLAVGQSVAVNTTYTLSAGNYTSNLNVDWFNKVNESNEGNNAEILIFTVP